MKIGQEVDFKPITIKLETQEEALAFWDLISDDRSGKILTPEMKKLSIELSNWFSNNSKI